MQFERTDVRLEASSTSSASDQEGAAAGGRSVRCVRPLYYDCGPAVLRERRLYPMCQPTTPKERELFARAQK